MRVTLFRESNASGQRSTNAEDFLGHVSAESCPHAISNR